MKKHEITIGGTYLCKVSGRIVPVRIDQTNPRGGWNATNTATGRDVHVRTAARLRRPVNPDNL